MQANREAFLALWDRLGGTLHEQGLRVWGYIESAYSPRPGRCYHTLRHIGQVLTALDGMAEVEAHRGAKFDAHKWDLMRWAVWFHDYVSTGSPQDEQASSAHAMKWLPQQCAVSDWAFVDRCILATTHKHVPLDNYVAAVCDCDLSILGSTDEAFDEYERQVREEWAHVPEHLFAAARAVILQGIARRPHIYMTLHGRERWAVRARANLDRSIAKLLAVQPVPQ